MNLHVKFVLANFIHSQIWNDTLKSVHESKKPFPCTICNMTFSGNVILIPTWIKYIVPQSLSNAQFVTRNLVQKIIYSSMFLKFMRRISHSNVLHATRGSEKSLVRKGMKQEAAKKKNKRAGREGAVAWHPILWPFNNQKRHELLQELGKIQVSSRLIFRILLTHQKWEPVGKKLKKQNKIKKIRKLLKKRNKKPIQLGDCKN